MACLKIHWYKFDKLSKQKNWLKSRFFCFFIGKMSATIDRSSWPHGPSRRGFLLCQNSKQTHKQGRSRTGNYQFNYPTLISWIFLNILFMIAATQTYCDRNRRRFKKITTQGSPGYFKVSRIVTNFTNFEKNIFYPFLKISESNSNSFFKFPL